MPDISKWNIFFIPGITNVENIFYNCKKIILFPDISKWKKIDKEILNIEKFKSFLKDINYIFPDEKKKSEIIEEENSSSINNSNILNSELFQSDSIKSNIIENNNQKYSGNIEIYNILNDNDEFYKNNNENLEEYYDNFYN